MTVKIHKGDCRDVLRTMEPESVHCVVTSPPYFGLRDYGMEGQIGLEPTPTAFVDEIVAVFDDVRRVLRKDGTVWLNLGDSYATSPPGNKPNTTALSSGLPNSIANQEMRRSAQSKLDKTKLGLKSKDLIGIPWRVAFALQADGWYLRQDIIWSKPNPMPESVRDRCTKAHEYIFLLSKSERYYFDAEAIKEAATSDRPDMAEKGLRTGTAYLNGNIDNSVKSGGRAAGNKSHKYTTEYEASDTEEHRTKAGLLKISDTAYAERNKRSVWEIATSPFPEAHFATFPPALIEPCILAGCPEQCCAKCGAPWVREVELGPENKETTRGQQEWTKVTGQRDSAGGLPYRERKTLGFSPACSCNAGSVHGTVLDPFGGAGTTGLVADRLGRNAVLIELNPEYAAMAERRIRNDAGMFANVSGS